MKKSTLLSLLLIVALTFLSGCNNNTTLKIDQHTWIMTTIQNNNGEVVAYGNDESSPPNTAILSEFELNAENDIITLTDTINNKSYTGSYKVVDTDSDSIIYDVKIESTNGKAVCSLTVYKDEKSKPTLIITLEDFTLNFFANETK